MSGFTNKIVDRVIMCLTNNENYIDFWNYISKVYRVKFNTTPTLMFSGNEDELNELKKTGRLSLEYGEIIHLPRVDGVPFDPKLDWTCTWGLFYGASLFPNDVCMLSGIDQIPLSGKFFDLLNNINPREKYVIGFSDAYGHAGASYPSSHHAGLGSFFKRIYGIENDWASELIKVHDHRYLCTNLQEFPNFWGLDEAYSSKIIRDCLSKGSEVPLALVGNFFQWWRAGRIDRVHGVIQMTPELLQGIRTSQYTEYHSVRPFSKNGNMEVVFENIPSVPNTMS
jgi:hypothetical protein